jgi:hypothetical protein
LRADDQLNAAQMRWMSAAYLRQGLRSEALPHDEEREHYPEKYRVAYSVAHHGHSSEHEEHARDRARYSHDRSDYLDLYLLTAHLTFRSSRS